MNRFLSKLLGKDRDSWEGIPEDWNFSKKQMVALESLRYYKILMRGTDRGENDKRITFILPMDLKPEEYVEVGYLISQLGRDDFPKRYSRFGFATDAWSGIKNPTIRFLDMSPGGYRVRVRVDV